MKKIKLNNKLKLNKEKISGFDTVNTVNIKGGAPKSDYVECEVKTKYYCTGCLCDTGLSCGKFC